ncbi:MAG: restriction endonuclease subunit S [Lutibacter sp.]|nr:MAG: restriction endonuclease subunit S [Lutibacter sp.]
MNNISKTTLGNLIEFQRGYDLPKSKMIDGIYPVRSSNGILGYHNEYKTKGPGITIGRSGTVGIPHLIKTNFYPHNTSLFIKDFKGNDVNYIFYFLKNLKLNDRKSGSSVPTMNRNHLHPLDILAHLNITTQKQIAKVLSDLDTKIEINNKINQELEAMAKTLYDYWFVQFDFPDANGKPYNSSGGRMVFNEALKREIPEGWEVKYLTEEMDLQYGFPFSTKLFNSEENGVPVIRIRDILKCSISNHSTQEVDEKYKLNKGDILVGMDGNFHINYWNKEGCYLNQRSLRIRSNENSITEIQTKYSIEPYIKAREKNVSRTTVAHLSAKDVNDLKVLKATNEIQLKANKFFKLTLNKIVSNRDQNQKLSELRNWLLPMLMNGQVTVGEVEQELGMVAEESAKYGNKIG